MEVYTRVKTLIPLGIACTCPCSTCEPTEINNSQVYVVRSSNVQHKLIAVVFMWGSFVT